MAFRTLCFSGSKCCRKRCRLLHKRLRLYICGDIGRWLVKWNNSYNLRELGIRGIRYINYRVAVDLLIGQGWEQRRPTLPKLYVSKARPKALVFLRLSYLFWENQWIKCCHSSITFAFISVYRLDDRCGKRKKTKAFGLALLFHLQDRVAHFVRNPALPTGQPLRGSW